MGGFCLSFDGGGSGSRSLSLLSLGQVDQTHLDFVICDSEFRKYIVGFLRFEVGIL